MKRSVQACFQFGLTLTPNFFLGGGRPQIIARPIQRTLKRTMLQWTSNIAWKTIRENRRNALERENQHRNDRVMENGEREGVVGKSEVAVMKGKIILEKRNIRWNAIADASGSLGGILVWDNEKSHDGNRRIGGCGRTPAIPGVLWEAKKNEVNASKDESERVWMEDGGHDSENLSADSMLYGPK
jgi:hypothetical protein